MITFTPHGGSVIVVASVLFMVVVLVAAFWLGIILLPSRRPIQNEHFFVAATIAIVVIVIVTVVIPTILLCGSLHDVTIVVVMFRSILVVPPFGWYFVERLTNGLETREDGFQGWIRFEKGSLTGSRHGQGKIASGDF